MARHNPLSQDLDHILDHTRDLWPSLRAERLFLTGGTGFIGRWLLESLIWANHHLNLGIRVSVLTRDPSAFISRSPHLACHEAVTLIHGDVRSFAFPAGHFSHVIHGAASADDKINREQPVDAMQTIVEGTRRTLEFATAAGVRRLLFLSSGAVYGSQPLHLDRTPETHVGLLDPTNQDFTYAQGKRIAESLVTSHPGVDCLIGRCFAFLGPYLPLDSHFAIGNFIRDRILNRPIDVRGDGTPVRSYLYAADLAVWLWTVLIRGKSGRPYNIGSDREISIADLARLVASSSEPPIIVRVAKSPEPGAAAQRYIPCTARAQDELGLHVSISLPEAIRRTCRWHISHFSIQGQLKMVV